INAEMHGHAAPDRSLPADLILTVNPASDSILARQMMAALYMRPTENARPFLVSLTSTADNATGKFFPIGTSLASTTKAFNDVPGGTLELWQFKRVTRVDVPYWDVKVDPSIIKDHGDIWNPRAQAMMAAIFRITNPIMNAAVKPKANLLQSPDFEKMNHP